MSIMQCPKDSFETVFLEVDYQDEASYYVWTLDGVIIKEGFGSPDLYTEVVTKEMILSGVRGMSVEIIPPFNCPCSSSVNIPLDYDCVDERCACIEDVIGAVEYIIPHECNLASFGGSLDLSTVIDPYWSIATGDTVIFIPIEDESDLVQDSFYFAEEVTVAQVAIRASCDGVLLVNEEVVDTVICDIFVAELQEVLYFPRVSVDYICNEDLTYDVVLSERGLKNANPPFTSEVTWRINGMMYEGPTIVLENIEGGTLLDIDITQCSLDGQYCCSNTDMIEVIEVFDPKILLPNGSCENDIWLFTIDQSPSTIASTLWDFGDGSGSTLISTAKGFLDDLPHMISVVVTNDLGCVVTSDTTVQSFPNNIDGEIMAESDPCASAAVLEYIENSESVIVHYEWSAPNSADSSLIEVTSSGLYTLTVTDENGCTDIVATENLEVNESFVGGLRFNEENCSVRPSYLLQRMKTTHIRGM